MSRVRRDRSKVLLLCPDTASSRTVLLGLGPWPGRRTASLSGLIGAFVLLLLAPSARENYDLASPQEVADHVVLAVPVDGQRLLAAVRAAHIIRLSCAGRCKAGRLDGTGRVSVHMVRLSCAGASIGGMSATVTNGRWPSGPSPAWYACRVCRCKEGRLDGTGKVSVAVGTLEGNIRYVYVMTGGALYL